MTNPHPTLLLTVVTDGRKPKPSSVVRFRFSGFGVRLLRGAVVASFPATAPRLSGG
jgi:hypothetical protein